MYGISKGKFLLKTLRSEKTLHRLGDPNEDLYLILYLKQHFISACHGHSKSDSITQQNLDNSDTEEPRETMHCSCNKAWLGYTVFCVCLESIAC